MTDQVVAYVGFCLACEGLRRIRQRWGEGDAEAAYCALAWDQNEGLAVGLLTFRVGQVLPFPACYCQPTPSPSP